MVWLDPDALEILLLQHAEQFGLQAQVDFADFIEHERAAVGRFEAPDALAVRAGERAAFVAEQFAFHQLGREHGAIQADQFLVAAVAGGVDRPGDQFLAGAAFAGYEHRFRRGGDLGDAIAEHPHLRA